MARIVLLGATGYTGRLIAQRLASGPDLIAWAAQRAAAGQLNGTGPLGPVQAFGLDELRAGNAAASMMEHFDGGDT
jgi:short subunit dehydrogenase-like uncharacterized protein